MTAAEIPGGRVVWPASGWKGVLASVGLTLLGLVVMLLLVAVIGVVARQPALPAGVLALTLPAFLAGTLSLLSPCTLPILVGYFTLVLREHPTRIVPSTLAFLAGLATTMAVLGASFTALGSLAVEFQPQLAFVGGVMVAAFGVMSVFGKGFAGYRGFERPAATLGGSYLFGLIFALGWTTCVGPILGAILAMLLVNGSSLPGALSLAAGGVLSMIYVLGLGLPLLLLVVGLESGGPRSRLVRALRGRAWEPRVGNRTLLLHSTSVISGVLLIAVGILLATGQMTALGAQLAGSDLAQWAVALESWIAGAIPGGS
jgi:cytochrome c-type biogenesis protein